MIKKSDDQNESDQQTQDNNPDAAPTDETQDQQPQEDQDQQSQNDPFSEIVTVIDQLNKKVDSVSSELGKLKQNQTEEQKQLYSDADLNNSVINQSASKTASKKTYKRAFIQCMDEMNIVADYLDSVNPSMARKLDKLSDNLCEYFKVAYGN